MNDIHPIKPEIVPEWTALLLFLFLIGTTVLLAFAIMRWRKRKPESKEVVEEVNVETERQKALKEMKLLDELIQREEWEEYYVKTTEVLKRYVSDVSGQDMVEMTTEEIGKIMSDGSDLLKLLSVMDKGKFAEMGLDRESVLGLRKQIANYLKSY